MNLTSYISRKLSDDRALPRSIRLMRAITIAGIAISVAALIVAAAVGKGFEREYAKSLTDFNAHITVVGAGEMRNAGSLLESISSKEILKKAPFIYRETLAVAGGKIKGVIVKGMTEKDILGLSGIDLHAGSGTPIVLVGKSLMEELKIGDDNSLIKLMIPEEGEGPPKADFADVRVTGWFESGIYDFDDQFILASIDYARAIFGTGGDVTSGIEITIEDPERAQEVSAAIEADLGTPYRAISWIDLNSELISAVKLERFVSGIIMLLMVVVSMLNIVTVLTLLTIYRLKVFSLIRALGVDDKSALSIFIRLGMKIGAYGVGSGIAIGILVAAAIGHFKLVPLESKIYLIDALPIDISPVICGTLALICLGVSYMVCKFTSRRLARVPIVEGL